MGTVQKPGVVCVVIIMGVSGCGKTTVGQALAQRLHCPFYDGDHFHPPQSVAKMARGVPLTDEDRMPWLVRLQALIEEHLARQETAVLACSALKKRYRDQLRGGLDNVLFVHLAGDIDLIWQRMQAREGHYMKAALLQSQFDTLEAPTPDEAITLGVARPVEEIIEIIVQEMAL